MSDERQDQETVSDIMSEMREYADSIEKHLIYDLSECSTEYLRVLADRIEAAHRRFYDKYKEHTDELNRQILVLKHEKGNVKYVLLWMYSIIRKVRSSLCLSNWKESINDQ